MLIVSVEGGLADMFGKPSGFQADWDLHQPKPRFFLGVIFSTFISCLSRSMLDGLAAV